MISSIATSEKFQVHAFRIHPNQELKKTLQLNAQKIGNERKSKALFLLTAVGSLRNVTLRLAHASKNNSEPNNEIQTWNEKFEIVSLVGTLTPSGDCHLHIALSNEKGDTIGGHLMQGVVFTTVEVVLGSVDEGFEFVREVDDATGYKELVVRSLSETVASNMSSNSNSSGTKYASIALVIGVVLGLFLGRNRSLTI